MTPDRALDLQFARWSFGWLGSDQLPQLAIQALEAGLDSRSLVELAGYASVPEPSYHRLLERALAELGLSRLPKINAGKVIARNYALDIVSGKLSPIDGAKAIWRVLLDCEELTAEIGIFAGRASEYEDLPSLREQLSDLIVQEAQRLVRANGDPKQ